MVYLHEAGGAEVVSHPIKENHLLPGNQEMFLFFGKLEGSLGEPAGACLHTLPNLFTKGLGPTAAGG